MTTADPEHKLERYQRLIQISQDLASTLDLNTLLKQIVRAAAELIDAEHASILLYDQGKRELYYEAATNLEQPLSHDLSVPVDASIAGWIVTHRQSLILSNATLDSRYYGRVAEVLHSQATSLLGVPMITKDKVVGAIEAINKRDGKFTQEDQEILVILGTQAALAIENSRLFQQSDLIAELVHELRTPLASLNTATALLLRSELPAEQRERVSEILYTEITRLAEMTDSFLDLARLESGRAIFNFTSVDPGILIKECADFMFADVQKNQLTLHVILPDELPHIWADQDKLKQVLINLISNAIKYNQPNGSISVSAHVDTHYLEINVSDTGSGISPDNMPGMFQKFYRAPGNENATTGTGLGLSICKRIIEAHHGTISLQSEPGMGSTFTIRLPLIS